MALLKCSACRAPMQVFFYGTVEIDVCSSCQASWFDARELAKVSGRLPSFVALGYGDRDCPLCAFRMQRGELQASVEADRCEHCRGFFLDEGELATLAGFDLRPTRGPRAPLPTRPPAAPARETPPSALAMAMGSRTATPVDLPARGAQETARAAQPGAPAQREASEVPVQDGDFWGDSELPREVGFACVVCGQRHPMSSGAYFRGGLACPKCTPQTQTTAAERAQANGNWLEYDWRVNGNPPKLGLTEFLRGVFGGRKYYGF